MKLANRVASFFLFTLLLLYFIPLFIGQAFAQLMEPCTSRFCEIDNCRKKMNVVSYDLLRLLIMINSVLLPDKLVLWC